ncbi:hypothetical protein E1A91_D12G298600v1 [Gossypium mustelinum]|uniref:Uncharacterized protein n=1 Tax=Gossypium mustelinum TaxID=34275 RepID=A0A5D2SKZ2_GOSMU|nr:hypothetical protein E1A91_D12G298600v1 [Gossypium mustelinum]
MNASDDHYIIKKTDNLIEACYYIKKDGHDPLWRDHSSLNTSLPFLLTQLFVVLFVDRILLLILKYLRQPPIVAHILCGVLLGPTMLSRTSFSRKYIFPHKTILVLETFANLALTFCMFLVGLEMEFTLIMHAGSQVVSIAAAGIIFPLLFGFGLYFMAVTKSDHFDSRGSMFWAIALTATNFPDLTKILADLKLLRTNIGKIAMCSAIISDIFTWFLLIMAISIFNGQKYNAVLSTGIFILISIFALRPTVAWLIDRTSRGEIISDTHVWFIMAGILLCGLATDACGSHSIVGAFMFGAILPHDDTVRTKILERLQDVVTGLLMPLFFLICGLRSDLRYMFENTPWEMVLIVIVMSWVAKVASVFFISLHYKMSTIDGLVLGLLMNTKGVLALIVLYTGRNIKALNNQSFPLMVLTLLVMSCLIEPIIALANKSTKKITRHMNRSIKGSEPDTEICILACVHSMRNVMGTISVLHLSNGTNDSSLSVFAIHLIELSKRSTTTMLIVHDDKNHEEGRYNNQSKNETANIIRAFENLEKTNNAVAVQTMSVISPYATMHVDICSLAEDKSVNLIILPFHKEVKGDGRMGNGNSNFANVNMNVLTNAPCSVAMIVDRGIGSKMFDSQEKFPGNFARQIAMLFIGGPDDREALAYAWRMASHPDVCLTVARFVAGEQAMDLSHDVSVNREGRIDDEHIEDFKDKLMSNIGINYTEMVVHNGEEIIAAIRSLGEDFFDLYIIGRRQGEISPVTEGLSDWGSCPELGSIGDTLVSSNFALHSSVLVVQHYVSTDAIHEMADGSSTCSLGVGTKHDVQRYDF